MHRASFFRNALLIASFIGALPVNAASLTPEQWQIDSLKGITSLRYGVARNAAYDAVADVTTALAETKIPSKKIDDFKTDYDTPLGTNEGRIRMVAANRENGQCWVGLSVEQRCQLKRTPAVEVDGETYRIGTLCPKEDAKTVVKELCKQFVKDITTVNGSTADTKSEAVKDSAK